jgi:rhodanese-related sulfurtransferase
MPMTTATLVAAARDRVENLPVAAAVLEVAGRTALLIDVRQADERAAMGVIPSSLHTPRGLIEFAADPDHPMHRPEFTPSSRLILYCASGARSALAARALQHLGFARVAHLEGGIGAWAAAGNPVELPGRTPGSGHGPPLQASSDEEAVALPFRGHRITMLTW